MKRFWTAMVLGMAAAVAGASGGEALDRAEVEREVAARVYLFELASGRDKAEEGVDWSRLEGVSGDELAEWAVCVQGGNPDVALELAERGFEEAGPEGRWTALHVARNHVWKREVAERMWRELAADLDEGRIPEELRELVADRLEYAAFGLVSACELAGDEEGEAAWRAEWKARTEQASGARTEITVEKQMEKALEEWEAERRKEDAAAAAWKPGSAAERHYRRGWEWAELGRLRDASAELRRAVERAREDGNRALADEAQAALAEVLGSSGRLEEARAECEAGLAEGSGCDGELLGVLARVEASEGDAEAFGDAALSGWWWSRAEGSAEEREGWDELTGRAAVGMLAEQLEVWAELCGERLEAVEWTEENREEIVGLLVRQWALEAFGHARGGGEGGAEGEGGAKDGGGAPEPPVREWIQGGWKGWAWKTDPAVPEIEREFCALLAGEEHGWDEWREKWGEDACGELMVDGMGAWAVALAARADEQRWHGQWNDYREELHRGAVEAFRKGRGFCAYRLVALLKGLAECVEERERMEAYQEGMEELERGEDGAEPAGGARQAADDTAWAEWADWATRAASGWRWAEWDAAWLRMELARRTGDAERAAREARAVLANHGEELWRWGREDVGEVSAETVMALLSGGNWEGLAEVLRQVAERGGEDGIAVLCVLADFLDARTVAGIRDLGERWVLAEACKGAEGLARAAWTWRGLDDNGAWTQARLAELEASGAWNSEEGERFAREAQERHPTLRGAGFLIRRAAARGDSEEAWRVWCDIAGDDAEFDWNSDEPAERVAGEEWRRRLLEMSRWCGEVPEEIGEEVGEALERLGVTREE